MWLALSRNENRGDVETDRSIGVCLGEIDFCTTANLRSFPSINRFFGESVLQAGARANFHDAEQPVFHGNDIELTDVLEFEVAFDDAITASLEVARDGVFRGFAATSFGEAFSAEEEASQSRVPSRRARERSRSR